MSEYIIDIPDECFPTGCCDVYYPDERDDPMVVEPIVRCEDCRFFDTRKCKSQWPFRLDGFCAWGERR